jgi:hypothetical protein
MAYVPTYTDRSLSPLRFSDDGGLKGRRRQLASMNNKDWALSEIYFYVKSKFNASSEEEEKI